MIIFNLISIIFVVIEIIYTLSLRSNDEGFSNQLKFKAYSYPQNPTYMNYEGRLNTVLTGNLL